MSGPNGASEGLAQKDISFAFPRNMRLSLAATRTETLVHELWKRELPGAGEK